ncbi:MAG: hypothetical protein AAGA96_10825 [Verrucomicrobiota bacterium]
MKIANTKQLVAALLIGAGLTFFTGGSQALGAKIKKNSVTISGYKRGDVIVRLPRHYQTVTRFGREMYYFDGIYVRPEGRRYIVTGVRRFDPSFKKYAATVVVTPSGFR